MDNIVEFVSIDSYGYLIITINEKVYEYKLVSMDRWYDIFKKHSYPTVSGSRKIKNSIIQVLKPFLLPKNERIYS